MNRGQKKWIGVCLFLFAIGGVCALALCKSTDPRLLTRARRITQLSIKAYQWRNAESMFLYDTAGDKRTQWNIMELDCSTGKIKPASVFASRSETRYRLHPDDHISPDSKWFLYQRFVTSNFAALEFASGKTTNIKNDNWVLSNAVWFPDNRRWVYLRWDLGFHPVEQRLTEKKPRYYSAFGNPRYTTGGHDVEGARLLGFIGQNRVLALPDLAQSASQHSGKVALFEFSVEQKPHLREYAFSLPSQSIGWAIDLSPNGKRLALFVWEERMPHLSPLQHLIRRIWKSQPLKPEKIVTLYTLKPDGSDWHKLGFLPYSEKDFPHLAFTTTINTGVLKWLPDGKHLSFIYRDALWTVPSN